MIVRITAKGGLVASVNNGMQMQSYAEGEVYEVPEWLGTMLTSNGRAVVVEPEPSAQEPASAQEAVPPTELQRETADAGNPVLERETADAGNPVLERETADAGNPVLQRETADAGNPVLERETQATSPPETKAEPASGSASSVETKPKKRK